MQTLPPFDSNQAEFPIHSDPFCQFIWGLKYRREDEGSMHATITRVCQDVLGEGHPAYFETADLIDKGILLPGGRILAGGGLPHHHSTLMNCYVMGEIEDSLDGIMKCLHESAITTKYGGGIGMNFGSIRPKGARIKTAPYAAGGPISFMKIWDAMGHALEAGGNRRGGKMAVLPVWHPDVLEFVTCKQTAGVLTSFNISVGVTEAFMSAVENNQWWDLYHWHPPIDREPIETYGVTSDPLPLRYVWAKVRARDLWEKIIRNTYDHAEPGVLFLDRMNSENNLRYREKITATNPCGEQPLPPYGACNLGSINLARLVSKPFTNVAVINWEMLKFATRHAITFLDCVLDKTQYPLEKQFIESHWVRRIGLGITGLADMLAQLNIPYDSDEGSKTASLVMGTIAVAAYEQSVKLARQLGRFPAFDAEHYCEAPFIKRLPEALQQEIKEHGTRNGVLLSIAPTGTISSVFGDVSSGCEPTFDHKMIRRIKVKDASHNDVFEPRTQYSYTVRMLAQVMDLPIEQAYDRVINDPARYPTAQTISVDAHLRMVAALQPWVDSAISKTINIPVDMPFEDFERVYLDAHRLGCKGCTTYRPSETRDAVIISARTEVPKNKGEVAPPPTQHGSPLSMQPLHRGYKMDGSTYKLRWPDLPSPLFVTINQDDDGPKEIFISSTNALNNEWTTAVALLVSKLLQAGVPLMEVAGHLKRIVLSTSTSYDNGRHYPSLVARIGHLLEEHVTNGQHKLTVAVKIDTKKVQEAIDQTISSLRCKFCQSLNTVMQEGCLKCNDCGNAKCD